MKKQWEFENESFCAVFNRLNLADKYKHKYNYCLPSTFPEFSHRLETFESEKEKKVVRSNFHERFNWDKLQKRIKMMLSTSTSSIFSHKCHNIIFEMLIHILTVLELGPPMSESSTWISKFYDPTDSEHKFH